ncbi:MAG: ATP-binding protein [Acidimicrobiia bacterium]
MISASFQGASTKRWLAPGIVMVLLAAGIIAVLVSPERADTIGFLGLIVGMSTAGILFFRRSKGLERSERIVWRMIGAGTLSVMIGILVTGVLTEIGVDVPSIGPLDAFFLGAYATLLVALITLARVESGGREWLPTILDALVGGISLAVLVWTTLFRDLIDSFEGAHWWQTLIAATYPILDVAVVFGLIILIIRRSHFRFDPRLIFLALGLSVQVVSDFIYLRTGIAGSFAEASPAWSVLLLATTLFVATAAIVDITPAKREFPELEVPLMALLWPYLLAAGLLAVHVSTYYQLALDADAKLLLDAVLAVGILVFLRQMVSIRRNQSRVERQRSELVASVSHELRTPLTAIVGYLNLLTDDGDDFPEDARNEMIAEASNQANHMARLVSDLVMLARGVHRNLPLEITEVSVSSIVNAALRGVGPEGTSIDVEINADVLVRVDAGRVQQALSNLLSNTVRYGGDTAILVSKIEGDDLVIEMHDNGDGVPTKYEAIIWQRFERGANRLNATNPGLGIGLAIVQAIVMSHGGSAAYRRSERLGGACFSLVLPGCVAQHAAPPSLVDSNR